MDNFVFYNPTKVYFGKNQLCNLGMELKKFGQKVLFVYGGNSLKASGLYDQIMSELKKSELIVYELSGVEPNPRHTTVNKGAAICKKIILMLSLRQEEDQSLIVQRLLP